MIKIAHESPLDLFDDVQARTDYDYALVHLFEESDEYYYKFLKAVKMGREVILDNSIFELGEAFDTEKYYKWIEKLLPEWYIIPDVLENAERTVKNAKEWQHLTGIKSIGVAQGKTYEEMVWCYKEIAPTVDKIAISFDYSFFEDWFSNEKTKYHKWVKGRQLLLRKMVDDGVIDIKKPHHLLGCGLPQEFAEYRNYNFIDSLDTSNPVMAGIKGIRYNDVSGLEDKPAQKLFTIINDKHSLEQISDVTYNCYWFRKIVNG